MPLTVQTPLEVTQGHRLADRIGLIPILRAGLGMVDAMLELMPTAQVWHLGLFRDERTLRPVEYYNKLPDQATVDLCLILDPMLATGGSATAAIEVLKHWGATRIKLINLIAAPEGVRAVVKAHPDVAIHTASLDRAASTRRATSCPAWGTPATASSAPVIPDGAAQGDASGAVRADLRAGSSRHIRAVGLASPAKTLGSPTRRSTCRRLTSNDHDDGLVGLPAAFASVAPTSTAAAGAGPGAGADQRDHRRRAAGGRDLAFARGCRSRRLTERAPLRPADEARRRRRHALACELAGALEVAAPERPGGDDAGTLGLEAVGELPEQAGGPEQVGRERDRGLAAQVGQAGEPVLHPGRSDTHDEHPVCPRADEHDIGPVHVGLRESLHRHGLRLDPLTHRAPRRWPRRGAACGPGCCCRR